MILMLDDNATKLRYIINKKNKELDYDDGISKLDPEDLRCCRKLISVFADHDFIITVAQAAYIWAERSDNWCAVWLDMAKYYEYDDIWKDICRNWAFYETTVYDSPFFLLI